MHRELKLLCVNIVPNTEIYATKNDMKTEPIESLSIKRANIVDKYLPAGDEQRYYERLEMHEELIGLINSHSLKIKQLEWDFYGTYYSAETPVGHYTILQEDELYLESFLTYTLTYNGNLIADFNRFEEATTAAQADFEKRIKECLE